MVRSQFRKLLKNEITVLEIGTAFGDSSTKSLYRNLKSSGKKFRLIGYEPMDICYNKAKNNWNGVEEVRLEKKYFLTKNAIVFFREAIILEELEPDLKQDVLKNMELNSEMLIKDFFYKPDFIFIDSIRYSHLAIIKSIVDLGLHKNATIIMEDDIPGFGEIAIIQKHFRLENISKHRCYPHQWPFVTYKIVQQILN
jgi:predicted O-methyltransferase YrrM